MQEQRLLVRGKEREERERGGQGSWLVLQPKDKAGTYPARWHFEAALMNLMPPKNALSASGQLLSCVCAYECACECLYMHVRVCVCASHIIVKLILHSCQPEGGQAKLSCVLQLTFMAFLSFLFSQIPLSLYLSLPLPDLTPTGAAFRRVLKANQSLSRNPMSWHFIFAAPHNKSCILYTQYIQYILYIHTYSMFVVCLETVKVNYR